MFEHNDITKSKLILSKKDVEVVEIEWKAKCDVLYDDKYSKNLPLHIVSDVQLVNRDKKESFLPISDSNPFPAREEVKQIWFSGGFELGFAGVFITNERFDLFLQAFEGIVPKEISGKRELFANIEITLKNDNKLRCPYFKHKDGTGYIQLNNTTYELLDIGAFDRYLVEEVQRMLEEQKKKG